jgi:hypothetical protein
MRLVSETDLRWVRGVWARASLRGLRWVREGVVKRGSWLGLVKAKGYQPGLAVQRLLVLFWAGNYHGQVSLVCTRALLYNSRELVLA